MKTFGKLLLRLSISALLTFVMLEAGLGWLCSTGKLKIAKPAYCLGNIGSRFWADSNPWFGVWHDPYSSFKHVTPDATLTYQANAWGMRDRERDKSASGEKRVVVLGDSFMEGWGVATEDRLSDRLERATGLEHLNFGTSGSFGPTQVLMLYTHLAKDFEHAALIISILPDNDFLDDDFDYCKTMHAGRIRPFFTGTKPDYKLTITQPPATPPGSKLLEQFRLQFTYTGNVIKHFKELSRHKQAALPSDYAGYFDFTPAQWDRMEHVLKEFRKAAPSLPILVITIPCDTDFKRTAKNGEAPLPGKMRELCKTLDIQYLDLLPAIQSAPGGWSTCYLKTDRHWNSHGNKVAAEAVQKTGLFYR
jgi:lysophospholipase L1-like esterase